MSLFFRFFLIHIKSQMQYKASFCLAAAGQFFTAFTAFLGLLFMFTRFQAIENFSFEQSLLCYAVMQTTCSLAELLGRGFDTFAQMLGNGEFDRVLVRPRGVIFLVLAAKMDFARLGRILQGALVLAYAAPRSGVSWTSAKILTLCLMILCGSLVFFGLYLIRAAFSFFTVEGLEIMNIFVDGSREFGRYPFSLYGRGVLRFLTFVIPLALVQYYPLLYLLDRRSSVFYRFAPILSVGFLLPAYGLFRLGLARYKSTGS